MFARSAPASDEWLYLSGLQHFSWNWVLEPLNEHWVPLPKVLYVAATTMAGMDVRGPVALMVVLLAAGGAAIVSTLTARGQWTLAAASPFIVFHPAQHQTLLEAVDLHFAICACLLLISFALAASKTFGLGWAAIVVLLTMTGGPGLLMALPLSLVLLLARGGGPRNRVLYFVAPTFAFSVLAWYQLSFRHQAGVPPYDWMLMPRGALEVLGTPLIPLLQGIPAGVIVATLMASLTRLLMTQDPPRGREVTGMIACIVAAGLAAIGIGYARGMYRSAVTMESRYASLVLPVFAMGLVVAAGRVSAWRRRLLVAVILGLMTASWPAAMMRAWRVADERLVQWRAFEADVRAGASVDALIGRHGQTVYDDDVRHLPEWLEAMRALQLGPFRDSPATLTPEPTLGAPYDLPIDRRGGPIHLDGVHFIRGVRVRFRLYSLPDQENWVRLQWTSARSPAFRRVAGIWVRGTGNVQEQLFWVWDEPTEMSLSVYGRGRPRLEIESLQGFRD